MATPITKLLPEIQLRVNSDPAKYDPNQNGVIDNGDELSTLLSEYKIQSEESLTSNFWGIERKTVEERQEMKARKSDFYDNTLTKDLWTGAEILGSALAGITLLVYPPVGLIAGGIILASHLIHDEVAESDAYDAIKAEQSKKAEEFRAHKRKHEAEMKAKEEAMNQKELEYRQDLESATNGIKRNVSTANRKAKELNKTLDEVQTKTKKTPTETEAQDSTANCKAMF